MDLVRTGRESADMVAMATARTDRMRAVTRERYGGPGVLTVTEVDRPVIGDDGILVRVRASSVNALEWHMITGRPHLVRLSDGLRRPKDHLLGVDVAGVVEAVGREVTAIGVGDEVMGSRLGAFAEYVAGRERNFVRKPSNVSFEAAAATPTAGVTALQALRDHGAVGAGQRVFIDGAAGGVGTMAVQIARTLGAHVTAGCRTGHVELIRSLGPDEVIDTTVDDLRSGARRFDVIIDIAGVRPVRRIRGLLVPGGRAVIVGAPSGDWIAPIARVVTGAVLSKTGGPRVVSFLAKPLRDDFQILADLLERGDLRPVIDRTYPLAQVADAVRHLESGRPGGKIVITT